MVVFLIIKQMKNSSKGQKNYNYEVMDQFSTMSSYTIFQKKIMDPLKAL